jgi:hypothetical protein
MIREVTELFPPRAGTGDAGLAGPGSPEAEGEGEAARPPAAFAICIGSILGEPLNGRSWDDEGRRSELRVEEASTRLLIAST